MELAPHLDHEGEICYFALRFPSNYFASLANCLDTDSF